ncbi:MAG: NrsF family protein, partial [Polyangiaceae bacterium]
AASRAGLATAMAVPALACAVALAGAVRSGGLGLGAPARRLAALAGLSFTVFVVGTMLVAPGDVIGAGYWGHTARCAGITCALAAAPLALGVWAFRRSFAVSSRWRGACLGAAAGALAATTMSLICAIDGVAHVVLGHGLVILAGAAAGAVFGDRILRA